MTCEAAAWLLGLAWNDAGVAAAVTAGRPPLALKRCCGFWRGEVLMLHLLAGGLHVLLVDGGLLLRAGVVVYAALAAVEADACDIDSC